MSVVRVLFMGTADFAVTPLESLISDKHFEVVAVVTQPDRPAGRKMQLRPSPVKEKALEHGITVIAPENVNTPEILDQIRSFKAEAAVVVAFGQLLKQDLLDIFPQGAVNIHGSLLPRWRGAAPIQRALMEGDEVSGVALQKIVLALDAGDVIGVRKVPLSDDIDCEVLYNQLKVLGADLLRLEFMDYLRGNLVATKQDEAQVCIAKKIKKEEGEINWNLSARKIFNNYRGLKMWPGVWTKRDGKMLKLHNIKIIENLSGDAGRIIQINSDSFVIACGEGALEIFEVQAESKPRMDVKSYMSGKAFSIGEQLG